MWVNLKKKENMMNKLEAHLAINKNRVKEYGDGQVYLKDGTQFQIELFNGDHDTYGAVIEMNGSTISKSKLVLKPGERIFLDRYLDDQVKFLFETYNVDGGDAKVRDAIKNNGVVKVKFFKEVDRVVNPQQDPAVTWTSTSSASTWDYYNANSFTVDGGTLNLYTGSGSVLSISGTGTSGVLLYDSNTSINTTHVTVPSVTTTNHYIPVRPRTRSVETGRVKKGDRSSQRIDTVDVHFEHIHSYVAEFKILPESQRSAYVSSDIKSYCTGCGTRARKNWQFCATCGTRI
jgi:hypothetical protein